MTDVAPLDEAIQLKLLDSLNGGAPQDLQDVARPTAAGLSWLAVPTACVGLAFRITNGTTLEAIAFYPLQVKTSVELSAPAVNLACSSDGRLIVVACSDGSLQCYNATSTLLSLRWNLPNAHSHVVSNISQPVSSDRNVAAAKAGPIHSLAFSPTGYALLMADAKSRRLSIFQANSATPANMIGNLMTLEVLCAAWSSRVPSKQDTALYFCAGLFDATVQMYSIQLDTGMTKLLSTIDPLEDEAMNGFVPTHLDWFHSGAYLAIGYCRCVVNDDDEAVEEDAADHDAALYIGTISDDYHYSNAKDLEEVVPFFSVPKLGRHVFFTAFCSPLLFVASNVASEVGVVVLDNGEWQRIDLQEKFAASCPTDEDDEFTFSMGISTVLLPGNLSTIRALLLASTDGSLSIFSILNQNDEHAFSTAQTSVTHGVAALPATPVETLARPSTPPLSSEPEEEEEPPANQVETAPAAPAPAFGSGASSGLTFGSGTAAPAFGQPSPLGAASSTFTSPPTASSASAFGSGGAVPTFGSGGSVPAFGSSGGGFAALAAASPAAPSGGFGSASPFGAFAKPTTGTASSMVKPLFGDAPSKPVVETKDVTSDEKPSDKDKKEASVPVEKTTIDMSSPAAQKAARVFDSFDDKKAGVLPLNMFEDMMDELGEGIHGDELEAQKALADPDNNGKVTRSTFISWYVKFVSSDGNDNDSLDSEDLAEREEEKRGAEEMFASLATPGEAGKPAIKKEQFQDLIEKFGTVYCEEEHNKTIEKLVKSDGMIYEDDFIAWYMKWLYEDESSDEEEDGGDEDSSTAPSSSKGWGDIFGGQAKQDTWKCDICSVSNDLTATKCVACETPKPGLVVVDGTASAPPETSTASSSSIGPGGFSFGGTSAGASGFSFGSAPAATTPAPPKTEKPSGFSFGGGAAPTGGTSVPASATTNVAKAQGGFSFGANATTPMATSTTTEEGEQKPAPATTAKTAAAGNLPGEKKAADVFDSFDENKAGTLPFNMFEDMMDEIGEGIHGDELEVQKALVDPDGTKNVTRAAFISWYSKLLTSADADDDDSLSTEAREEREEEKRDAEEQFASLATPGESGKPAIKREQFQDLIEKFGTVYCEEEHNKSIEKLVKSDGMIYEDDFIAWYMKWLFEDGSFDEEEDDIDGGEEDNTSGGILNSSEGWGNTFSEQGGEDTWKCDICMVRNDKSATKCASCETKPGLAQSDKTAALETSTASGSSIGPGGFSFGGTSAGASGFSFGSKTPAAPKTEDSSGFSFGGRTAAPAAGGFSFGNIFAAPSSSAVGEASSGGEPTEKKSGTQSGEASKPEISAIAAATTAPPSKASASSSYPPISTKAPSPFGGPARSTASSAYPPMSSKPPVPFGGDKSKSTTASTTSGPAAFPPLSSKAPSPFSAVKSKESPASKATGSAAFPPLSSKAPSPFSAIKPKESAVPSTSGSAAFPPMSSTAPSPFSAVKSKESPASKAIGSAAFPPLSSKAPSPFSAVKPKESAASSTSGSAAFPPMSSTAPSPFSAVKSKETPASKATSSAAFPPLSSKAPKPFGGSGASQATSKPLGTSSFPPLSSQAPKPPFGGVPSASTSGKSAAPPFSTSALKTPPPAARASVPSPWKNPAVSDYETQFRDVVGKFQKSISSLADGRLSQDGDAKFESEIEDLVREKDSVSTSCTHVRSKITKQKERSIFVLSRKTDIERQTSECRRQINIQEKSRSDQADVIEKQPLDAESERSRRSIAVKALMVNKTLELLENRTSLLRGVCRIDDENEADDSVPLSENDRRNILLQAVTSSFQNAKSFEEGVARAHDRVVGYTDSFPAFPSDLVSTPVSQSRPLSGRKSRHRLTPVSLGASLASNAPISRSTEARDKTEKWSRIEQAVRRTKSKSSVVPVKTLTRLSRIGASTKSSSQSESITARPLAPSLLLSPTEGVPLVSATERTREKRITFSSPPSKLRPDWNVDSNIDQEKMKGLSLGFPQHLNKIDATEASRQALSGFGTTPEKSERAFELKKSSISAGKTKSSETASSSRSSSAAAFPPMRTKAPTPFSAGKSSDKGSSHTKQSSAYPPVAPKAPKPFSSGAASKPTEPKSETSKPPSLQPKTSFPSLSRSPAGEQKSEDTKGTPAFGDLKGLGDSLFAADSSSSPEKSESDALGLSLGTSLSSNDSPSDVKSDDPDYRSILVEFYSTHNPSRLNEVDKTLEKYKGREVEMFGKLGKKYNVPSPLESTVTAPAPAPSSTAFGSTQASPFSTPVAPMPSSSNTTSAFGSTATGGALGAPSPSPFGASASQPSSIGQSPFGKPAASPFGSSPSPFGPPATSQASPFGQPAAPQPAPAAPSSTTLIGGREPREVLVAFYQKYNQSRLGEVDKVLLKYKGNEEQLFRNLAKKYNLDPTIFGLSPTPPAVAASFGQPSTSGGFGQTSQSFGTPSTSGFGQTSSLGGNATFGSPSPAPAFGSPSAIGGGQTPFGSMPQPGTQQTTPFGGSGMQQTGGFGSLSSGSTTGFGGGGGAFGAAPVANPFGAPRR